MTWIRTAAGELLNSSRIDEFRVEQAATPRVKDFSRIPMSGWSVIA
jgi:hypothetical protein